MFRFPNRLSLFPLILIGVLVILASPLALAGRDSGPLPRGAAAVSVDVDLPSTSTGVSGGTLALRIFAPASAGDARYTDGAPVLVYTPGGDSQGTLRPALRQAEDVIRIVFLFPGGSDPLSGRSSDGAYDHRGANSIAALRDVIRFAAGRLSDPSGKTIDDLLSAPVLHDNIGLLGASNGGNIVAAVAAQHGALLAGNLRYVVQWESPVSSQIATVDLGGVNLDCPPSQRERLDVVNPRYTTYGPLTLTVDYSQIVYDATDPRRPVFLDGNGDGRYTTVLDPASGCRTPDLNGNGALETDEDFPLSAYTDGVKHFYSRPVTQALVDSDVFGASWPTDIATVTETGTYWDLREATRLYGDARTNLPGLEGMVLASLEDHVQSPPDHPHIRQAFEGWDAAGAWVQLNPDPAYLVQADPSLSGRSDLPAFTPNTPPGDWSDEAAYTVPEDVKTESLQIAAVWQMADRAHTASSATPTATTTPTPSPTGSPAPSVTPTRTPQICSILPCHLYLPTVHRPATLTPTLTPTPTPTLTSTTVADVSLRLGDPVPDSPIHPLLGVNAGPAAVGAPGNADLTSAYRDMGATLVRTHDFYGPLDMAVIYPDRSQDPGDPASYDFSASDAAFAAIIDGGFEPYLRIGDSWNNVTPPVDAAERANWAQAAVNVMKHYTEGQWDGFDAEVRYVEIWNEPDGQQFWPAPRTRLEFFQLYAETAKALSAALPGLKVGGPGFSPAGAFAPGGQQFVRDFLDYVKAIDAPLDFLSWHVYSNDPSAFAQAAAFYRAELDGRGFTNVESHISEWNTSTRAVNGEEAIALRAGGPGAARMSAAWIALQNAGVREAAFYRGGDQGADMAAGLGLFYADGRPKKVALAFSLWAQMAAHPERLALTSTPDSPLWIMAGRNGSGDLAFLIVNPTDTASSYRLLDAGGQALAAETMSIQEVNDASETTRIFIPNGEAIPIDAYTVHLVTISPATPTTSPTPLTTLSPTPVDFPRIADMTYTTNGNVRNIQSLPANAPTAVLVLILLSV